MPKQWQIVPDNWRNWTSGHIRAARVATFEAAAAQRPTGANANEPLAVTRARARQTVPLGEERTTPRLPYQPPVYEPIRATAQMWLREPCLKCHGDGTVKDSRPYCDKCWDVWTDDELAAGVVSSWRGRWKRLPCGHDIRYLVYTDPICPACHGSGGPGRWFALVDIADVIAHLARFSQRP